MKYSAGLANRAVMEAMAFKQERGKAAADRASECQAAGYPGTEEGMGSQGRGEGGLEPQAEGCLPTTLTLMESYQHMRVSVYACVCVCVCACVYVRGQGTVFSGKASVKFQPPVCKGTGGKCGVESRCTDP